MKRKGRRKTGRGREKIGRTYGWHRKSKIAHKPKGVFEVVV